MVSAHEMLYPLGMDPGYRSGKAESVFRYWALLCTRERELAWKIIPRRSSSIETYFLNHLSENLKNFLKKKSLSISFLFQLRKFLLLDSPSQPTSLELEKGEKKKKKKSSFALLSPGECPYPHSICRQSVTAPETPEIRHSWVTGASFQEATARVGL